MDGSAEPQHRGTAGLTFDEARRKVTKGLLRHWRPTSNPIPRLTYLALLYKNGWPIGPTILLLVDLLLELQIQRISYMEIWLGLKKLDDGIRRLGDIPKSEQTHQIIRNGHHVTVPKFLLVKGDIICSSIKPKDLKCEAHGTCGGEWKMTESPLHNQLEAIFLQRKLIRSRFELVYNVLASLIAIITCILGISFKTSISILLPAIFISLPLAKNILYLYTNTRMHLLSEMLCSSNAPFYEGQEIDEFDEEALPPTKDIHLSARMIVFKMWKNITVISENLFWNHDVTTLLGTITFLVFLDKKYLLSIPIQIPDQIILPGKETTTSALRIVHRSAIDLFDISLDFSNSDLDASSLKGIGLGLSLFTGCLLRPCKETHSAQADRLSSRLCPCALAKSFGFKPSVLKEYRVIDTLVTSTITSKFVITTESSIVHSFSLGELAQILPMCTLTWSGSEVITFELKAKEKFFDIAESIRSHGFTTFALTYRPCRPNSPGKLHRSNHIFLGFVIFSTHPRDEIQEFIDDLGGAGIRFVYFSTEPEVMTKTFGSRLGLEMDWNSCILFSAPPNSKLLSVEAAGFSDPKSKLPRGVQNVRPHLLNVDDIPLRLSLFAECDPNSVAEMIKIYQENDEVVVAVGMATNLNNLNLFTTADLGIVMDTPVGENASNKSYLTALITGLLCPINIPQGSSPYFFTELIREARTLFRSMVTALTFFTMAESFMLFCLAYRNITGKGLSSVAVNFIVFGLIPWICLAITVSEYEAGCMKQMPEPAISNDILGWSMAKAAINVLWPLILPPIFGLVPSIPVVSSLIVTISSTNYHLLESIISFSPLNNIAWKITAALVYSISFVALWWSEGFLEFCKLFMVVILTAAGSETLKYFWRQKVYLSRRRAKLEFNTRLGMHSPR